MRLTALATRRRLLRFRHTSNYCSCPALLPPPTIPLRDCPACFFTSHSPPPRSSIGRIHPVSASSRTPTHDPAASLPDLFDIPTSDKHPRTTRQRIIMQLRRSGRVAFAVCVTVVGVAALGTIGYELLVDPAHSAHAHSFQFVQHHPVAVRQLGGGRLIDLSDPMRGQLCHDSVRQVGEEQWAQCTYRVRGDAPHGGEGEVTAVLKRGKRSGWLVVYVTLDVMTADGRRERVVVCDYRNQVQREH